MRNSLRSIFVALSMVCGIAAPANAGTVAGEARYGTVVDWSGFYLGLHGGYGWSKNDTGLGSDINVDGWLGGGHIGLQRQFDRWVVGIEASFTGGTMDGSTTVAGPANIRADVSDILMVTGRLGYAWKDLLIYAKGGYASAEVDISVATLGGTFTSNTRLDGWTAGGGLERKLTNNVSLGIEYNYIDLDAKSFTFGGGGAPTRVAVVVPPKPTSGRLDPDGLHTVMARLTFSLGGEPERAPYK